LFGFAAVLVVVGGVVFFGRIAEWGSGLCALGGLLAAIAAYFGDKAVDPDIFRYSRSPK
jgi:hypothetical protein